MARPGLVALFVLALALHVSGGGTVRATVDAGGEISSGIRLWTEEELAAAEDLLLVVVGEIYDVKGGEKYYEGDGGYGCFIRKDRTRAFVSGKFTEDETDDLSDMTEDQCLGILHWVDFYRNHATYKHVGRLVGTFWDAEGRPTAENLAFQACVRRGELAKEEEKKMDEQRPRCASRWSAKEGGKVWCEQEGMLPRITSTALNPAKKVCRCFELKDIAAGRREDVLLYDGCDPFASECKTTPPKASPS